MDETEIIALRAEATELRDRVDFMEWQALSLSTLAKVMQHARIVLFSMDRNGTTTMSKASKRTPSEAAISLLVGITRPLAKCRKRIVGLGSRRLVEQNAAFSYAIAQRVAGFERQSLAHLARDHGLAFDRDFGKSGGDASLAVHRNFIRRPKDRL